MVLLIWPTCIINVGVSPLSFSCFVVVLPLCIFTRIASAFISAYFSASIRSGMPFFTGTTIARLIATSFQSIDSCSNLSCLNPKDLYTSCTIIGTHHPSEKYCPPIHIPSALLKITRVGLILKSMALDHPSTMMVGEKLLMI